MKLEQLGMMMLLEYGSQLGAIKHHAARAAVEMMKALEETLKLVQKGSAQVSLHPLQSELGEKVLEPVLKLLRFSGEWLEREAPISSPLEGEQNTVKKIKTQIVRELVGVLDRELIDTSANDAIANPWKSRAILSIKQILIEQLEAAAKENKPSGRDRAPNRSDDIVISLPTQDSVHTLHVQADREAEHIAEVHSLREMRSA